MNASAHIKTEPDLPKRIGRYDAFLQIGTGGMASVYLGVQHGPFAAKKLVAIKRVREEITSDQQYLEMFIDEARIALRLNHHNVVHTYEVLDEAPEYYLVMEFLDGQSLLEVLRRVERQKMPLHEHIWILTQLLAGLHYAHELRDFDGTPLNIVHRDVTPSNVFVCRSGEVKLLDFGIAKATGAMAATRTGMIKGKLGYVSPEQCLGQTAGVRSDIYAVGVMLWEAMARRRRVSGEAQAAQLHARIQGTEPPIERVWPQAPPALVAMTKRALSVQPEHRYASARDFQRDLEGYLAQQQSQAGPESVGELLRQQFKRERAALYLAIESHIGISELAPGSEAPTTAGPAAESLSQANDNDSRQVFRSDDDDVNTSLASMDDALLRASMPGPAFVRVHRSVMADLRARGARFALMYRALASALRRLRPPRTAVFLVGVVIAASTTLWLLGRRSDEPLVRGAPIAGPPSVQPAPAPKERGPVVPEQRPAEAELAICFAPEPPPAALVVAEQVAPAAPQPSAPQVARKERVARELELRSESEFESESESRRPGRYRTRSRDYGDVNPRALALSAIPDNSARIAPAPAQAQAQAVRPIWQRGSASSPSDARYSARRVKPGMDLWGIAGERSKRNIDEQDPYAQ